MHIALHWVHQTAVLITNEKKEIQSHSYKGVPQLKRRLQEKKKAAVKNIMETNTVKFISVPNNTFSKRSYWNVHLVK